MQNPFQDVLELENLEGQAESQQKESDSESLEPPFEIHGIQQEEQQPEQVFGDLSGINDGNDRDSLKNHVPFPDIQIAPFPTEPTPQIHHPNYQPRNEDVENVTSLQVNDSIDHNHPLDPAYEGPFDKGSDDDSSDDEAPPLDVQFEQKIPHDPGVNTSERSNLLSGQRGPSPSRQYDLSHLSRLARARLAGNHLDDESSGPQIRPAPSRSEVVLSWKDVYNMDEFLVRLYQYYEGKGFLCISTSSLTSLITVAFVVILAVFLTECINYSLIPTSSKLEQVLESNCVAKMSWFSTFLCVVIGAWWIYASVKTLLYDIPRLVEIKNFVNDILNISDLDLQTMLWKDFTAKIVQTYTAAKLNNPGRKLDAHIIASRIMRRDNYVIALFNKEILDLSVPFLGSRQWLTRMMQDYIIYYGIFGLVYNEKGNFKKRFLKEGNRHKLALALKKRFQKMAFFSLFFSPFLFIYLIIQSFFKLSEEYRQNPALLTARTYSPLALCKIREYNELPHLFNKRISRSHENSSKYLLQFPNHLVVIIARFISFLSGSLATVLVIITLFEEEFQKGFEITPNRSALFYIGLFGSILAVTQGFTQENTVYEPQRWMNEVILDTHYNPDEWREKAHLPQVRDSFALLFDHKLILLVYELLSVLLIPLFLYTRLPDMALGIVDFIRDFTVRVDSMGYICSFSVFDFEKHGDYKYGSRLNPANNDRFISKNGKMEQSFMNFKTNNPDWNPGERGSEYVSKIISKRPYGRSQFGALSSRVLANSQYDLPTQSMVQGISESLMGSGLEEGQENVVREVMSLLDAFYVSNR